MKLLALRNCIEGWIDILDQNIITQEESNINDTKGDIKKQLFL